MASSPDVVFGVIDDARARQVRHRRRRVTPGAAAIAAVVAGLVWAGGGRSGSALTVRVPSATAPIATVACVSDFPRHASARQRTPSQSLLSILAILRRPARRDDATVPSSFKRGDPYLRYIRLARVVLGSSYYVIPTLGQQCKPLKPLPMVLLYVSGNGNSRLGLATVKGINLGGLLSASKQGNHTVVSGLVPDDVATVALRYPAVHGSDSRALPAVTITARPVDNIVAVTVPRSGRSARTLTMIWRAANGRLIKTFARL